MAILFKTYAVTGERVSVLRDANANDVGYDDSPGVYQVVVEDSMGLLHVVLKSALADDRDQHWPVVAGNSSRPEHWNPVASPESPIY